MRIVRTSLLVDLNGRLVGVDANDFSYKVVVANTDLDQSAIALPSCRTAPTSSYMAQPIMSSAIMTGLALSVCSWCLVAMR